MKAKDINKVINWGLGFSAAYLIGTAIAGAIKKHREQSGSNGIGKIERIKRRIYKEVSLAQDAGVDFTQKYAELSKAELDALEHIGKDVVGWKQSKRSIESGKPYTESYYNSLRRAWNAVSGIQGIGRAYNVKDANGNVCLTWIEDAAAHVDAEHTLEAEQRAAEARKRLRKTRRNNAIAPITPSTPAIPAEIKSRQQQILDKYPYLKIMDDPFHPISNSTAFTVVVWRKVMGSDGSVSYEGPAMAFNSRAAAEDAISYLKRKGRRFNTNVWADYYKYMPKKLLEKDREYYAKVENGEIEEDPLHYSLYDHWHASADESSLTIKDVSKINMDKISGIGYAADVESELYEIWREQIEYGETDLDYDTWRELVGDEYAKSDILPYM